MAKKDDYELPLIFRQCRYCLVFFLSTEAVTRHNAGQCHFDNTDSRFSEPNRTRSLRFPMPKLSLERVNVNIAKNGFKPISNIPPSPPPPKSKRRCRIAAEEKLRDLQKSQSPEPEDSSSDEDEEILTEKINSNSKRNSENKCPFKKCGLFISSGDNLQKHIERCHKSEKAYKCPQKDCSKAFANRSHLRAHMRKFHGLKLERPYRYKEFQQWKDEKAKKNVAKCRICGKAVSLYYIKSHEENHKKNEVKWQKKRYNCPLCGIGVKDRWNLRRHFIIHLENNPFVCKFSGCGVRCGNKYSYQKHIKLHFNEYVGTQPPCQKCGISYRNNARMRNHKCITDPNKIVVGKDGRKYSKRATLRVQRMEVEDINIPEAGSLVKSEGAARHHNDDRMEVESVHFVDNIVETEDGAIHLNGEQLQPSSSSSVKVENGHRRHEDPDDDGPVSNEAIIALILKDPVYKRLIKEKPEVETEMMGMDGDGSTGRRAVFACSKCNTRFTRYCYVSLHEKHCHKEGNPVKIEASSNSNEVQLMCIGCGFQASSRENLEHHYKTAPNHGHLTTRNHKCVHTGCGLLFETEEKLESHIQRIHLQEKPFKCNECQQTVASKMSLKMHIKRKHSKPTGAKDLKLEPVEEEKEKNSKVDAEIEVIICKFCGVEFRDRILFLKHKRREHQQEIKQLPRMKCEICGDTFAGRHSLQRHIRAVHARTLKKKRSQKSKTNESQPPTLDGTDAKKDDFSDRSVGNGTNQEIDETEQCILGF